MSGFGVGAPSVRPQSWVGSQHTLRRYQVNIQTRHTSTKKNIRTRLADCFSFFSLVLAVKTLNKDTIPALHAHASAKDFLTGVSNIQGRLDSKTLNMARLTFSNLEEWNADMLCRATDGMSLHGERERTRIRKSETE